MSERASSNTGPKDDLDTLIHRAEARIVAADQEWQRHGEQLTLALRGNAVKARKAGIWGGVGLAALVVGAGVWRWRSKAKAKAEARTVVGRAKGLAQGVADQWAGLTTATTQPKTVVVAAPPRKPASRSWELAVTTLGLLIGAAARSGLKSSASSTTSSRPGVAPAILSVGLPMLSRWLRSQAQRADVPRR